MEETNYAQTMSDGQSTHGSIAANPSPRIYPWMLDSTLTSCRLFAIWATSGASMLFGRCWTGSLCPRGWSRLASPIGCAVDLNYIVMQYTARWVRRREARTVPYALQPAYMHAWMQSAREIESVSSKPARQGQVRTTRAC